MRVLHILPSMDPELGGVCQAVKTIVKGLSNLGSDNEILSLDNPDEPFLEKEQTIIHAMGESKNSWRYSPKLTPWLKHHIDSYDVIILHGLWQYHGFALQLLLGTILKKIKVYIMPHGMLDPYFQTAKGRKLKAIRNWLYWHLIEKYLINKSTGVIFTCQTELILSRTTFSNYRPKQELIASLGVEYPPIFHSRMADLIKEKLGYSESERYILFLSRIQEKKGVDILIFAYEQILSEDSTADIPKLVIAGPGIETEYGTRLFNKVINSSDLRERIIFPGMLQGDTKWGAFYLCDAFILPSHQENFGIAVVEAMACEKPVLISDQVNIWREISEAAAGVIDEDNLDGTVRLLRGWMKMTKNQRSEMGRNARALYSKIYTVESASRHLTNLIS